MESPLQYPRATIRAKRPQQVVGGEAGGAMGSVSHLHVWCFPPARLPTTRAIGDWYALHSGLSPRGRLHGCGGSQIGTSARQYV
uniref:Uncharacterized protein n=1 Tax=Echinococcus granulosus TaxID=6210 RepID=A0A068WRF9_ECHGR|nr:hypothetical protein EgrG_000549300 [Echinococcus granulosus]